MAKGSGRTRARRAEPDPPAALWDDEAEEPEAPPTPRPEPRRRKPRARPILEEPEEEPVPRVPLLRRLRTLLLRGVLLVLVAALAVVALVSAVNPPTTPYIWAESSRLGGVDRQWAAMSDIAPAMARSAVAAEDANFCNHWGLDLGAIRAALASGGDRGGSTISQQVAKNVFLWHGRNWARKALEAAITPAMEATWSKRRILEVYLNVAEFGEGIFGVEAAAWHYFGVAAADLSDDQAARLAAVLPAPKSRNPADLPEDLLRRVAQIRDGAATIAADGRAACFEAPGP